MKGPNQSRYSRSFLGASSGLAKIPTWKALAPFSDFAVEVAGIQSFTLAKVNPLCQISPWAHLCRSSWPAQGINGPGTPDVHTGTALMPRYTTAITPGTALKLMLYPTRTVSSIALAHVLRSGEAAPGVQHPFQASQFKEDVEKGKESKDNVFSTHTG